MPLNPNIILQAKSPEFLNPMDIKQKAMTMKQLAMQNQASEKAFAAQEAKENAFKNNVTQGEDGSYSLDKKAALADLMKSGQGTTALELQGQFQKQDRESEMAKFDMLAKQTEAQKQLAWAISGPENYSAIRQKALDLGLPNAQNLPEQYPGDGFIKQMQMASLSAADRLAEERANRQHQEKMRLEQKSDYRWNKTFDQKERLLEHERGQKQRKEEEALTVPGLGLAQTKDDAKKLKDAVEMKSKFDRQIGELIDLRKEYGVEYFNREAVGRGKQLSKDLLLTYKNLAKLGVLSKSDEDIINAIIPSDPLGQDYMLGQDSILHQLEKFKGDLDDDYKTTVATRLRNPEVALQKLEQKGQAPKLDDEDRQAITWAKANPSDPMAQQILSIHGGGR